MPRDVCTLCVRAFEISLLLFENPKGQNESEKLLSQPLANTIWETFFLFQYKET